MTKILSIFFFLLTIFPAALSAQGKDLKPGFGLHISPWVAPTNVPPKARSLQPRKRTHETHFRSPLQLTPLDGKAALSAVEIRAQGRDSLWSPSRSHTWRFLAPLGLKKPTQQLPADFRFIKNSSIRPPPCLIILFNA